MSCLRIFPELEVIFIHLPKTGGMTVRHYLSQFARREKKAWGKIPAEFAHFDRFTIIRNPFDRMISSWSYCTERGWCHLMPPGEFLRWALDNSLPVLLPKRPAPRQLCKHHTAPQTHPEFLLHEANQVFRFEELGQALESLGDRFGFSPEGVHLNSSPRNRWEAYRTRELSDLVRERFAEDFQALGYSPAG